MHKTRHLTSEEKMSTQKDNSLWEFLDSRNFESTENLKLLSNVLSKESDTFMREYNQWFDELPPNEDDDEDDYFRLLDQEEKDYESTLLTL